MQQIQTEVIAVDPVHPEPQVVERAGFPFVLPSSSEEFEVAERTAGTAESG